MYNEVIMKACMLLQVNMPFPFLCYARGLSAIGATTIHKPLLQTFPGAKVKKIDYKKNAQPA